MNQNIWGPHLWFSLHTISFNYPLRPNDDEKKYYYDFFNNLQEVIPCSVCKKNYKRHLNEHPIKNFLNTRKTLVYWVIDMHNMVNGEIGKKTLSYENVIKKYENVYKKKIIFEDDNKIEDDKFKEVKYSNEKFHNLSEENKNNNKMNIIVYIIISIFIILLIINFFYLKINCKK